MPPAEEDLIVRPQPTVSENVVVEILRQQTAYQSNVQRGLTDINSQLVNVTTRLEPLGKLAETVAINEGRLIRLEEKQIAQEHARIERQAAEDKARTESKTDNKWWVNLLPTLISLLVALALLALAVFNRRP